MWWLLSCAFALGAFIYLLNKTPAAVSTPGSRVTVALLLLVRLLFAIVVLGSGYVLEPFIWGTIKSDPSAYQNLVDGLGRAAFLGLALGSACAIVADQAKNLKDRLTNVCVSAVLGLVLVDDLASIFIGRSDNFAFSLASDVFGGVIAGVLIALVTEAIKKKEAALV